MREEQVPRVWAHGRPPSCVLVNPATGSFKGTKAVHVKKKQAQVTMGCFSSVEPVTLPGVLSLTLHFSSLGLPSATLAFTALNLERMGFGVWSRRVLTVVPAAQLAHL